MRKPLNIAITCYPTFGGSGVVATEIGMEMARRGHKVHFISYDVPRRLDVFMENIFFHEVEVHDYPLFIHPPYSLSLTSKMVEVATFEAIDLFHVHYAIPHATSAHLAREILGKNAPRTITTLHGTDITLVGNERSYLPITRFSIQKSCAITCPSYFLRMATYDKLNVSTDHQIEVIPNFVDIDKYKPTENHNNRAISKLLNKCLATDKIITHVSNFRPVKRIDDVIKVFNIIAKQVPARLIFVGDGPERSKAEELTRTLGISDRVYFLGKQENFVTILQDSDLFILPSEAESFGLAALEAMSCGVPVIASNTQGIPELVVNGGNGYCENVGDVEAMAQRGIEILTNKRLEETLRAGARETAVSKFSLKEVCTKYEDLYYKTITDMPISFEI